MNALLVLSAVIAVAVARPGISLLSPYSVGSQYHSQDALGQYSYGYSGGLSSKSEVKTYDGVTRGGYSYIDANGILQSVSYTADPVNGFRVSGTNLPRSAGGVAVAPAAVAVAPVGLPQPVQDTPEVAAAKVAHYAAYNRAAIAAAAAPEEHVPVITSYAAPVGFSYSTYGYAAPVILPGGVPADTPEVASAKAAHYAAHAEARARLG